MTKHYQQKLAAILTFTLLSCGAPLLLSANALALENRKPEVATTEIASLIAKLKSNEQGTRQAATVELVKVGSPAIPALIEALKNENKQVREGAVETLAKIGKPAIPELIEAFKDDDQGCRCSAQDALKRIGQPAVPPLIHLLKKDHDRWVRKNAAYALGEINAQAKEVVPVLRAALKDPEGDVRSSAALSLGKIGVEAKAAIPDLIAALKEQDKDLRQYAAWSLGMMGVEAKVAVPDLIVALRDQDKNVRRYASQSLGRIGVKAITAVPNLILALKDRDKDVRRDTAWSLGQLGVEAKDAVPQLIAVLKDQDKDVRNNVVWSLGSIGAEAKDALPELTVALKDKEPEVRSSAASALARIAVSLQGKAKMLPLKELEQVRADLEAALSILRNNKVQFSLEFDSVRLSIEALKAKRNAHLFNLIRQNKWVAAAIIYLIFFPSLWSAILRLRPIWILPINDVLKSYDFKLPEALGGAPIRIRDLTFIRFFIYRPRVLDAWVSTHIETVREQFTTQETVKIRATYIPVSFELDNKKVTDIRCQEWQSTFTKNRIRLLIWGEGGIGKTSIACQIAEWAMEPDQAKPLCKHLMIPILIEEELKNVNEGKDSFLEAINGQLKSSADLPKPIDEELLKQLLQQRRLLVIVDHFSEMSETTQKAILPNSSDFPVNALVVTSRLDSTLGKGNKTTLHPLRIEGAELSVFMQKYLEKLGKIHLFGSQQFHYACGDLAKLLEGIENEKRSTTVLFAKLYADMLIAKKMAENSNGSLQNIPDSTKEKPDENIPEFMLSYLNEINKDVAEDKLSDNEVHEAAQLLAWECLKLTYRPTSIKIKDALNALSVLNIQDNEARLKYLEDKLRILQRKGSSKDNISFILDPVAEYLAGLHLVDNYGNDDSKWCDFIINADFQTSLEAIKGFMLAVRDCYLAKIPEAKVTDYLPNEIAMRYP